VTKTALAIIKDAQAELGRLRKRRDQTASGFVFETRRGLPTTNAALSRAIERSHAALCAKQVEPWGRWTRHDLRQTMRTGLSGCNVRPDIAEMTIGHTKPGIIVT
jgi:hypothetical protein